jgi:hypothetical protein
MVTGWSMDIKAGWMAEASQWTLADGPTQVRVDG